MQPMTAILKSLPFDRIFFSRPNWPIARSSACSRTEHVFKTTRSASSGASTAERPRRSSPAANFRESATFI